MFIAENDELCPFDPFEGVKSEYTKIMPNAKHDYYRKAKDQQFMNELINQL